jgi:hypothetical protein
VLKPGQQRNMMLDINSSRYKKENHMCLFRRHFPRSITIAILLVCCGIALAGLGVGGCVGSQPANPQTEASPTIIEASYTSTPSAAGDDDTLTILKNNRVPPGDWRDEAMQLKGIPDIPEVVSPAPVQPQSVVNN